MISGVAARTYMISLITTEGSALKMYKLATIILLFLGEAFSVYAEMIASKAHALGTQSFAGIFAKATLQIAIAGALLIAGYMLGYRAFKNIWIVSAVSIASILIMEPFIGYLIFKQLPTLGAVYGLLLGTLGFIATFVR